MNTLTHFTRAAFVYNFGKPLTEIAVARIKQTGRRVQARGVD